MTGIDRGSPDLATADHLARDLVAEYALPDTVTVCTHLIRTGTPHVALSFEAPADFTGPLPSDDSPGAESAAVEHRSRRSGRAVLFPGSTHLTGTVPITTVLATAINHLTVLGGTPATDNAVLHTRDHVRPEWREGHLTLTVTPAGDNTYAPFEVPNPTPCCADH
ncbi:MULTISPECIES: hypothetical protein [unclassified Crossiella]|uniref:hypothetical protein n=1 Tax=unclassified Crossiella TaxID=2620835 RepID=UPI001FFFD727|nr:MULTISPECIES: hypothetical protein [unclassified Crossiella]MCK2243147.1 hypothetical protein [Crossiella sp. S99.2]MCK2257024.1 hypothetical protein [Crossiella sp. S99.1]